jgi:sugar phosphate permease
VDLPGGGEGKIGHAVEQVVRAPVHGVMADAGIASGLINTSQQIGGAIGVAVATTVATTFTARYLDDHTGAGSFSPAALTHGFSAAFYVLAGMTAVGALIAAVMLESKPAEAVELGLEAFELEEA